MCGRTVVIVAHRLSTVARADRIVVLDRGRVVEQGTPQQLLATRGLYYQLVRRQMLEINPVPPCVEENMIANTLDPMMEILLMEV